MMVSSQHNYQLCIYSSALFNTEALAVTLFVGLEAAFPPVAVRYFLGCI